jgi:tetratricopeptide (TPR) repeat protein
VAEVAAELRRQPDRPRTALLGLGGVVLLVAAAFLGWARRETPAYEQGRRAYRAGDYRAAEAHFTAAINANEEDPRPWFGRGRARLLRGDVVLARDDFREADQRREDGVAAACIGYCQSLKKEVPDALAWYDEAIKRGYATAAVFNNRGHSRMQRAQLDGAEEDFTAALERDPDLQAALYNRALVALARWTAADKKKRLEQPFPAQALEDIRLAIRQGPVTGELFLDAARCCACAVTDRTGPVVAPALAEGEVRQAETRRYREEARSYLELAVLQQQQLPAFERNTVLKNVLGETVLCGLAEQVRDAKVPPANLRLVDPAPDLPE